MEILDIKYVRNTGTYMFKCTCLWFSLNMIFSSIIGKISFMKQTINQIQFTCFCINQSARGTKKTKESIMSRFPSPVFWQRGQWRKFKSDELFKKGGTLPSGYHGHHAPSTVKILHRWIYAASYGVCRGKWREPGSQWKFGVYEKKIRSWRKQKDALWQTKKSQNPSTDMHHTGQIYKTSLKLSSWSREQLA